MKKNINLFLMFTILSFLACDNNAAGPDKPTQIPEIINFDLEVNEDSQITFSLPKTDNSSSGLTYTISENPQNGNLNIVAGNLTYIPNPNFFGIESFSYTISNESNSSILGDIVINVLPVNDSPIVQNGSFFITSGDNIMTLEGEDIDDENLVFRIVVFPSSGTLDLDIDQVTYNGPGGTSFDYVANDGEIDSNRGRISIISQD